MAYSYKGAISFGLIYIPITLHAVIKNNDIAFHMLDKKTKSRIQYKKTCVDCDDREVKQEDIVKGYEYEKDKYVILTDEDFEKIKSKKDKNITIERFVDINEIDPIYYEKAYYVAPTGAEKAYSLLIKAMEEQGKVGIARTVLGTKDTLIALRTDKGKMLLNTLYFYEEVQACPTKQTEVKISDKELDMAKMLIDNMTEEFNVSEYKDEYRIKVMNAIDAKIGGQEIIAPKERAESKVIDLMQALEMSLKNSQRPPKVTKRKVKNG